MALTRIFGILLICLALTACDKAPKPHYKMPAKFQPAVNPHPKYFITVKGRIDPALKNVIHLSWISTYQTTNPKCRETINRFEGVSDSRRIHSLINITPDKSGHYEKKIPLDYYKPGFCGWDLMDSAYKTNSNKNYNDTHSLGLFTYQSKKTKQNKGINTWKCNSNGNCKLSREQILGKITQQTLSNKQNYQLLLTFKRETNT